MDFSGTFDTTNALSGMYLWLIFGFLSTMINCDLQRFMQSHPLMMHAFALMAFFFLFTLIDTNNKADISVILVKTIFIYILFVLMTKSKWYFVIPVLSLLLIDQGLKKHVAVKQAAGKNIEKDTQRLEMYTNIINVLIIFIIIIGSIHYMYLQQLEYGKKFSLFKFFFGISKCKKKMPNYEKFRT